MLQLLTTEVFAEWFTALDDKTAEDVATLLDLVEELGPAQAPPDSHEGLLWYEHPSVANFDLRSSLAWDLEAWAGLHDYTKQVIAKLESPRFASRLSRLGPVEVAAVFKAVAQIKQSIDPRSRWTVKLGNEALGLAAMASREDACAKVRSLYLEALEAAGFRVTDVPAHSLGLRELSRRAPAPAFRLVYGVHVERRTALFVLGEWLDRSFYGDSVRRAEQMWKQFLDGQLRVEPAQLR